MLRAFGQVTPSVDPSCYVDPSAQVIGDVTVGPESGVWMNAVVRGDINRIRIGARPSIQDGTIIHVMRDTHPTTIGDEVTVGHGVILHGCTIERVCLVGMGAIVLNGVHVGTESIVAAGSLLVEGFRIPPRSLVMGSPGRIRWELTEAEVESIRGYASRYVEYRKAYLAEGTVS